MVKPLLNLKTRNLHFVSICIWKTPRLAKSTSIARWPFHAWPSTIGSARPQDNWTKQDGRTPCRINAPRANSSISRSSMFGLWPSNILLFFLGNIQGKKKNNGSSLCGTLTILGQESNKCPKNKEYQKKQSKTKQGFPVNPNLAK